MSGFYIGVDGKARKVKGGYIGVDGKARKIKKGYIGDENGIARLCWSGVDPVFANNTWEEIAAACQTGAVPDTWAVGDQKTMTIDGTDYAIDIIGKNHDDYSDGSGKAPLTFQLHDCYKTTYGMNGNSTNLNGWKNSNMVTRSLPAILALLPVEVNSAIKEVNKLTSEKGGSSVIVTTTDKLFLLSEVEVFGSTTHSTNGEGQQYEYYKQGNPTIKYQNGKAQSWWERSPCRSNDTSFCNVLDTGVAYNSLAARGLYVSFAFCF